MKNKNPASEPRRGRKTFFLRSVFWLEGSNLLGAPSQLF